MGHLLPLFLIFALSLSVLPQHLGGIPKYFTPNEGLSSGFVRDITQDNQGFIWMATDEGLNRFDGMNFITFYHSINNPNSVSSNKVSFIKKDVYGKLWIGYQGASFIDILDPSTLSFKKLSLDIPVAAKSLVLNFIFPSHRGSVYVNFHSSSYIAKIDAKKHSVELINVPLSENSSSPENISSMAEVASSKIIITTTRGRIFLYDSESKNLQVIQDFNEPVIISQSVNGKQTPVYAISESMTAWVFNNQALAFSPVRESEKYLSRLKLLKIHSLFADTAGNLWINKGFQDIAFAPEVKNVADFSKLSVKKLMSKEINSFLIDYENNIWLATAGYGALFFPDRCKKFTNFSHSKAYPQKEGVRSLRFIVRKNDKTYIGGYDGLQILDKNNHLEKLLFSGLPIRSAIYSVWGGKEIIWLGPLSNQKDIFWYDINSRKTGTVNLYKLPEGNIAYYDIFEENEFLWLSTSNGIIRYDRLRQQMSYYFHNPEDPASLPANAIRLVRKINEKYIAAVVNHGLVEINPQSGKISPFGFTGYGGVSLPKDIVLSLISDSNGDHWLGTNGEGLFHINHQMKAVYRYSTESGLPNNTVYSILNDKNGDIWGATNQGIFRFDRTQGLFRGYVKSDGIIENEFNSGASFIDDDGTLFFGGIQGFTSFKPEDIKINPVPPRMALINITVNNIDYTQQLRESVNGRITLPHDSNYISISFTSLTFNSSQHTRFAYKIEGLHSDFINLEGTRILQLNGLDEGVYNISITGTNSDGIWAETPLNVIIVITPSFAESWIFYFIIFIVFVLTAISWADWREKRLTKQKEELEHAVRERTRELEIQNKEIAGLNNDLQTALTVKNKFLSIVAHDLKTPFTALLGYSEILTEDIDTLPKDQITLMISELGRLSQQTYGLILNLLNWTQLQTNRITLSPEKVNINEAVLHCRDILSRNLKNKQITFNNEVQDEFNVYADKNMVNTIILNLINNAYKFTNPGGEIRVSAQQSETKIKIMVADNGVGMSKEKISTLFSEEKNESYSGTLGEKGTGLGLLLIKELLDFARQDIYVESEPDKGTKITFSLDIYKKETN